MKHIGLGIVLILIGLALLAMRLAESRRAASSRRASELVGSLAGQREASTGRAWLQVAGCIVFVVLGILVAARVL